MSIFNSMEQSFRWYGPNDPVSLQFIRQAGATAVFSSLHHIPYGEEWSREEIRKRKDEIESAGLKWNAVESVPVHEDIRTRTGNFEQQIENYKTCIRNLAAEGINIVIYNFMPVLDWVRTDLAHKLEDGSECLYFDPIQFAAFEIYSLKREGAENDYTESQLASAKVFWDKMNEKERSDFELGIIDVFPGCKMGLTVDDLRVMLAKYKDIDAEKLKEHLSLFLQEVVPVAHEVGVKMAIHPDDPPYSILGLPRILSTEQDVIDLYNMVDLPENGLCFCSGSFSPRDDNDLPGIITRHGHRIHAVHLRNTQKTDDGAFYEADHLDGRADMYAITKALLEEIQKRNAGGETDVTIPFRPDHGHTMMDDLSKTAAPNPGYTCIGRMRGLAELRGLMLGVARNIES